jgi:beta-galactosidase/beta-glucuronidase
MPTTTRTLPRTSRRWGRALIAFAVAAAATSTLAVAAAATSTLGVASGGPATAAVAAPPVQDGYAVANNGAVASVDLAGTWSFTPLDPPASTTTIQVPGGGWIKQGFTATKQARYSRSVTIPSTGGPQTVMLELGAVNHEATLRIGTVVVGTRTTSFTPSSFDLTPHVTAGGTYTLTLDVKGREALTLNGRYLVPEAAEWSKEVPQGIYRSAFLRVYPQTYIEDTFVRTSVADGTVTYDVTVRNTSPTARTVALAGAFSSYNGSSFSYPSVPDRSVTVAANSTTTATVGPLPWTAGAASYWWPNVPYTPGYRAQLHVLTTTLGGASTQTVRTRFGFREFTQPANQTKYFLNGVPVNAGRPCATSASTSTT